MGLHLTEKQIGLRISKLRRHNGLSQNELANAIDVNRTTITQLELGNRKINALELQKLAHVFRISLDRLLADDLSLQDFFVEHKKTSAPESTYRISQPTLDIDKFINVFLYILERCAGKPNVGETVLYKLLYFADFNHYELYEEHLTGARYHKLPFGPVPQNLQEIIHKMLEDKLMQRIKTDYHGYKQTRYIPLRKPNLREIKASEIDVIDRVIEQFSDWSASAISTYSHKDIPWIVSKDGEEIDYELALYREAPFSVRNYDDDLTV